MVYLEKTFSKSSNTLTSWILYLYFSRSDSRKKSQNYSNIALDIKEFYGSFLLRNYNKKKLPTWLAVHITLDEIKSSFSHITLLLYLRILKSRDDFWEKKRSQKKTNKARLSKRTSYVYSVRSRNRKNTGSTPGEIRKWFYFWLYNVRICTLKLKD